MKIKPKLTQIVTVLAIILGGIIFCSQLAQLITINKTVKEISNINSEASFTLQEDAKVKITYRYVVEEGKFNILLKNQETKTQSLITSPNNGQQIFTLSQGNYTIQVRAQNFKGLYHINAYKL